MTRKYTRLHALTRAHTTHDTHTHAHTCAHTYTYTRTDTQSHERENEAEQIIYTELPESLAMIQQLEAEELPFTIKEGYMQPTNLIQLKLTQ